MLTLNENLTNCSKRRDLTSALIAQMQAGTAALDEITVQDWLQIAFIHALDSGVIHLEQPVVYGGQAFNIHMCIDNIGPSPSLDDALGSKQ
jgi:hypothetical protein